MNATSPAWRTFRRNPLSWLGLFLVVLVVFCAIFAPFITPYPDDVGAMGDVALMNAAPSAEHWLGTDGVGRDVLTRIIYGYRLALILAVIVLVISPAFGILLGLIAGYVGGWREYGLMRFTDVFISIPPLVLAMAILGFLEPNLINGMLALTLMWWPWYTRLVYNITRSEAQEGYVLAARVAGASTAHILFREILPNCMPSIITKITIDVGFVVLMVASLSFVGLGAQPPTPDLGTMVADGTNYMPDYWWLTVFPAIAILLVVLGFNLLGDGLREAFEAEV